MCTRVAVAIVVIDDFGNAGGFQDADTQRRRDMPLDGSTRGVHVQFHFSAEKPVRIQIAEDYIGHL
jgi:hypothetical protein